MSADDEKPEFQEPGIETTDDNSQSEEETPDPKEKTQEKGEAPLSKEYQASEKSGGLRGVIITAAFTFLGVVIGVVGKGGADVFIEYLKADGTQNLERQKLDNDLVELAMHQKTQEDSGALLGFMVETKLIRDKDIRDGVQRYLTAHATKGPILSESPTIVQFLVAEQSQLSVVERHQGDFSNSWIVLPPRVDETIKKSSNPGNSLVFFNPEDAERAGIIIALLKSAFSLSQLDLKVSPKNAPRGYFEVKLFNTTIEPPPTPSVKDNP